MKVLFLQFVPGVVQEPVRELDVTVEEGEDVTYAKVLEAAGTPWDPETMAHVTFASPEETVLDGSVDLDATVEEDETVAVYYKALFVLTPKEEAPAAEPDKDKKD